jgi:hypothetical protein
MALIAGIFPALLYDNLPGLVQRVNIMLFQFPVADGWFDSQPQKDGPLPD